MYDIAPSRIAKWFVRSVGYPLHHFSPGGDVLKSFGTDTPQYHPDRRRLVDRIVAESAPGKLWAVPPGVLRIELWNVETPERLRTIQPVSQLFGESDRVRDVDPRLEVPLPRNTALWESTDGRLWILAIIADSHWRPVPNLPYDGPIDAEDYDRIYDTALTGGGP
jgi:hypothetical protein